MRKYLKKLRIDAKLSQLEVARKLDISESYYSLIENGQRQQKMDIAIVQRLADAFDVPVTYIVENETKIRSKDI